MSSYQKKLFLFFALCLLFLCTSLFSMVWKNVQTAELEISFLDVGQGDAIFIQTPNQKQMLIDGGPKDVVLSKLKQVMPTGDKTIDMIMITNPDADHMSGFDKILDEYMVGTVFVSGTRATSETYKNLLKKIEQKNITQIAVYKDMQIVLDTQSQIVLTILFPDQVVRGWERNDGSIVSRLQYGDSSVMLMGDATLETEKIILEEQTKEQLSSNILKLGHHGSKTSSSEEWIDLVLPDVAIVSAGLNNRYGHPHKEVIDRLHDRDIQVRQTSTEGTIRYISDGISWVEKNTNW